MKTETEVTDADFDTTDWAGDTHSKIVDPNVDEVFNDTDEDPVLVPAEVFYNGTEWYRVGICLKGNSSLQTS
jgi:spore coat protein H